MSSQRGEFGSRFGFIMAAAGSAVGLGNIWGFPTQAASNGGAAFVVVYLLLAFLLAYPVLMAELTLGRHAHGNMITALAKVSRNGTQRGLGTLVGIVGIFTASLILSFYAIVSGWMIGFGLAYPLNALGATDASTWLSEFSFNRNLLLMLVFMVLTMTVVAGGVEKGIERWSKRLMPALIVTLVALALYVLTLDGAAEGLAVYLVPDLSKIWSTDLIFNAMGAAFFSLSLGVGTAQLIAKKMAGKRAALSPAGMWVVITTASDTPPARDRSKPPCCTTSIWPKPTMAIIAAKGRLPIKPPVDTAEGAKIRHITIKAIVETTTVTNPRVNGNLRSPSV